ncbi:MAG: D-aminoacylase, partial [Acidobacteria bacterium]|nr:D-aminoacylase [Acidobacteriota bacterium]
ATIDVNGMIVAPGFIDLHNHSSGGLQRELGAVSQIMQGITTAILGPDGGGPYLVEEFMRPFDEDPPALNIMTFVGHATIRRQIMGADYKRPATADEISRMSELVETGMREGAVGLSSGLEYDPGFYSTTEEIIALAKVAARYGGTYMTHMRDEADKVMDALKEAIEIGRAAKIPVHISHIKLGTVGVWGKASQMLAEIDRARTRGIDISADAYPYLAWSSGISVLVPSRKFDDPAAVAKGLADVGGAKNILITRYEKDPTHEFKTLEAVAQQRNMTPVDLYIEIMKQGGAGIVCTSMTENDLRTFYRNPWVMVASDGGIGVRHPRGAGTFPRVLGAYVRENEVMTLERAIRKMTGLPAARLGLKERGVIRKGAAADVVVFDAAAIRDNSTFQEPLKLSEGMKYVFVNGVMVVKEGQPTDARPGLALR